ncbi:hypothetical protein CMK11_09710, partial [Candidatus Poribacteria bacterium]|nr:hypothetical protein [Candidatus Poribacteria bacterium]
TAHAHREALIALASYSDIETMRELAALASDPAYPHTSAAVDAFSRVAWLWETESQPVWEALVQGPDVEMASRCVAYVEKYRPKNSADLLTPFMDTDDASLMPAARRAWARAVDGEDHHSYESLEILVEMDGRAYEYDDDIRMTVDITNAGERPVTIDTFPFDQTKYIPSWLNLELILPNGERRRYPDRRYGPDLAPSGDANRVLQQGQSVATAIDVRQHDRYPQPGTHVATVAFGTPLHFMYATPPSGLPELVRANTVTFDVAPPSNARLRAMVDSLSAAGLSEAADVDVYATCYRLGELREPSAIPALVRFAGGAPTADFPKIPEGITRVARRALARYTDPALTPLWIELLGKDAELAIAQLSKSGDARAIGPLRRLAFGSYRTVRPDGRRMFNPQGLDAALALRELGDEDALAFLRWEARRGMDPRDMRTWQQAVGFALQAMSDAELLPALRDERPGVRYAALGPAERRGRVDVMTAALTDPDLRVRRRAVDALAGPYRALDPTPAQTAARERALTDALDDAELTIRRSAALALASAGNRAGEALLRRDRVSADHATRMRARAALSALRRSR